MPILMWIAFWSNLMGIAAGWQETALPIRVRAKDRRDRSTPSLTLGHPEFQSRICLGRDFRRRPEQVAG